VRDFRPSGALAADAAPTRSGKKLAWTEPPDAALPTGPRWRCYTFKGSESVGEPLVLASSSSRTAVLFGRDRAVADVPLDHPSCSSQHAVVQFRRVGSAAVRPYIMDVGSTNGTFLNGEPLRPQVYVELRQKDVVRFAQSSREYVFLREDALTK
jgi:smad nuclear-interacting protein 1